MIFFGCRSQTATKKKPAEVRKLQAGFLFSFIPRV